MRCLNVVTICVAVWMLPAARASTVPDELPVPKPHSEVAVIGTQSVALDQLPPKVKKQLTELQSHYARQLRLLYLNYQRAQQDALETGVTELLEDRLLHMEAEAQKVTTDMLREQLAVPDPTPAAVKAYYDEHGREINQPFEKVALLITTRLKRDAAEHAHYEYFGSLERKYSARVTLAPLRQSVEPTGPARGAADASITIVEFADFQCPYCRKMAPVLKRAIEQYPHDVRLVYRYMPLSDIHPDALSAARAGFCAAEQGKFWEMHDAMFADPSALGSAALLQTAASLKLDGSAFSACLNSDKTLAAVRSDYEAAVTAGVSGTPGLFINGRYLSGAVSWDRLAGIIDSELRRGAAAATAHR
jgi:protein-disulfide isomerase